MADDKVKRIWGIGEGIIFAPLNAKANGTYNSLKDGIDGYNKVNVNVPNAASLQTKTITDSGTFGPDEGYDGFSEVTVEVGYRSIRSDPVGSGTYDDSIWESLTIPITEEETEEETSG